MFGPRCYEYAQKTPLELLAAAYRYMEPSNNALPGKSLTRIRSVRVAEGCEWVPNGAPTDKRAEWDTEECAFHTMVPTEDTESYAQSGTPEMERVPFDAEFERAKRQIVLWQDGGSVQCVTMEIMTTYRGHFSHADTFLDDSTPLSTGTGDRTVNMYNLVGRTLEWLMAENRGDFDAMKGLLAPTASMFGAQGVEDILTLKRTALSMPDGLASVQRYAVDSITAVDVARLAVTFDFECRVPGREGYGTETLQFNNELLIIHATAVRPRLILAR